tara:strand:- start:9249 stop:9725 length:477 start_codon:yes stop_codon:yes gene_type:complete
MDGKQYALSQLNNILINCAFYYLRDRDWQVKCQLSNHIGSKDVAERILIGFLHEVGIDKFIDHAGALQDIDLDDISLLMHRHYGVVLYYLLNSLDDVTIQQARELIKDKFKWTGRNLSNCIHQFLSHSHNKPKREAYPLIAKVFKQLVMPHIGRPKNS